MDLQSIAALAPITTAITGLITVIINNRISSKKEHANLELLDYISFKISSKKLPNEAHLREIKTLIAYKYNTEPANLYPLKQAIKLALISCLKNASEPIASRMQIEKFYYSNPQAFANISDGIMLPQKFSTHFKEMLKMYIPIFVSLYLIFFFLIQKDGTLSIPGMHYVILAYSVISSAIGTIFSYLLNFAIDYSDKKYQFREKNRKTLKNCYLSIVDRIKKNNKQHE